MVIRGPDRGLTVRLGDIPLSFGAGGNCAVVLSDTTVSRRHFEAALVGDEVIITDCGSRNGCLIQGLRVERAAIGFGTEIKLGRTVIKFVPDEEFVEPPPSEQTAFGSIIGSDPRMRQLFTLLGEVATKHVTVLIEGETGTGKELIAEELHKHSSRRDGPFIVFDCGSVPRELVASILFGHVRGAFTGALSDRRGVFAEADGGTLFLDEIGEMALELQPALLRALDKKAVCRVGSSTYEKFDVRVVAATNRDLRGEVAQKRFREDLYYRELRNVMERACLLAKDCVLDVDSALVDAKPGGATGVRTDWTFRAAKNAVVSAFEREYIEALLTRHHHNLSAAAREAQIDRKHLRDLMVKHELISA